MSHDVPAELARFARARIAEELGGPPASRAELDALCNEWGASFVTLHWDDGRLQGCIGSLEPRRSLVDDVERNALAAAFADPRAVPIASGDLPHLSVEVSVLSPLERVTFDGSEEGACAALRAGTDGVLLVHGARRGTFLPQMWDELETPENFLVELKRKARLPPEFWSPDVELHRYTVTKGAA